MSQLGRLAEKKVDEKNAAAKEMIPRDGLPAVGFLRPGLFCVVSHSGITLGHLLGELAAIELDGSCK